jgi:hypothetical protein
MSRTRGITINSDKTLTLTTTNDFDGVSYSEYMVVFPISGDASTTLVKSGEGNIMLDSDCNVGTVRVDSGTLALGTNFVSSTFMPSLVLAVGAQIELADGVRAEFSSATLGTDTLAPGFYTGTGGPAYATAVSWISGTGTLLVRPSEAPTATVADTWKATDGVGTMSAASSWVGENAPDLETGEFLPTFADAGSGAVVDENSIVKGIVFNAPNDFTLTGSGVLTVLGGGSGLGLLLGLGGEHLLQGVDLMGMGHAVEDHIQLIIAQHLGIVLGLFKILAYDLGDLLGIGSEIGSHIAQTILLKTHIRTSINQSFLVTGARRTLPVRTFRSWALASVWR